MTIPILGVVLTKYRRYSREVLRGLRRHLRIWLRNLEGDLVSKAAAAQLEALLLEFRETSAARSHPTNAMRPMTGHGAG